MRSRRHGSSSAAPHFAVVLVAHNRDIVEALFYRIAYSSYSQRLAAVAVLGGVAALCAPPMSQRRRIFEE